MIQYQGQLLPGISKIQDLNNRGDAISVIAISTEKEEKKEGEQKEGETAEEKKKPAVSKDVVKLMVKNSFNRFFNIFIVQCS